MSGGGHYQRHGMMRLKNSSSNQRQSFGEEITEEVVNELENTVKVLSNQFNQLQQQVNEHKVRFLRVFHCRHWLIRSMKRFHSYNCLFQSLRLMFILYNIKWKQNKLI